VGTAAGFGTQAYAEKLYVFYPNPLPSYITQQKLKDILPGADVMVFGRYGDFARRVATDGPNVLLTKAPVIRQLENYKIRYQGIRKGDTAEPYVFLSVGKTPDPADAAGVSVGIYDILGRKGMAEFLGNYFKPPPQAERVSQMEDLLQLLTFNMAEAILIPEFYVNYFKEISNQKFVITPVPDMKVSIIAAAVKNGCSSEILEKFREVKNEIKVLLEVEDWKDE
jgi:hypothetical protein